MMRLICIVCAVCVLSVFGKSPDLILKSANTNMNTMTNGEIITVLQGNVVFLYDDATIRSDYAKWCKSKGTVSFANHIVVTQVKKTLKCNQLDYDKNKKWLNARGNVDFYDAEQRTKITGMQSDYYTDTKLVVITGKPVLIHYDTIAHDTLVIKGERMSYDDSLKIALVQRSVTIRKGKLFTQCQEARYYPDKNLAQLRFSPKMQYENDSLSGDSVDLFLTKKAMRGMSIAGKSQGRYKEFSKKDTMITHMFGDSMYLAMNDSGHVDSLFVYRNVKSEYFSVATPFQTNEVYGKVMAVAFNEHGDVDNVKIWGNARSLYHIADNKSTGCNIASGDSVFVAFKAGKASRVRLSGSVRGSYAPDKR